MTTPESAYPPIVTIRQVSTAACWLAIVASFVLSFSTWLALGELAGFGSLAVALPFCVDGYTVTALTTWLAPGVSERLATFAKRNLYVVGIASVGAQAGYHSATVAGAGNPDWKVFLAAIGGGFPPLIATLAVHIRARLTQESAAKTAAPEPSSATQLPTSAPQSPPLASTTVPSLAAPYRAPVLPPAAAPHTPPVSPPAESQSDNAMAAAMATSISGTDKSNTVKKSAVPQRKVEQSASGPQTNGTSLADVRRWADVDGLTHKQIAARLGVSHRTAARRIAAARADKSTGLTVVAS